MSKNFEIINNSMTSEIYIHMHEECGFYKYEKNDVDIAIKNNLFSSVIYDDGMPIAMVRVVGDGKIVFFIKDLMVKKEYRNKGVGNLLMKEIFSYLNEVAANHAYIGLMSTPNTEYFYERHGFIRRPNDDFGSGMVKFFEK